LAASLAPMDQPIKLPAIIVRSIKTILIYIQGIIRYVLIIRQLHVKVKQDYYNL